MRIATLAACALLFAGSAAAQSLRIGLSSDPDALDPTLSRTVSGRQVFAALCDKLVDIDASLNLVPQLATAWRWEDADKTLVLSLRPGVRLHDGSALDGETVEASLRRHLTLPGSTRKAELGPVESVEASGPLETRIHLTEPFAPLVAALADRAGMIMPRKAASLSGAEFLQAPLCSGPFRFVRRVAQDRIELERFAEYWNAGAIHFDRVIYHPIPDATVRALNLRSGQLDLIETVQPSDIPGLKAARGIRVQTGPSLSSFYIAVNVADGPRSRGQMGQSALVREALDKAIDRKTLVDVVFDGLYVTGNQSVPPGSPFYVAQYPVPARDLAGARALLKAAGLERVAVELSVPNSTDYRQAGEVIQAMAAEAGIEVKLNTLETVSLLQQWTTGDFETLLIQWSGRVDVDANLYNFNACGMALNGGHYCNPKLDTILNEARRNTDMASRMANYTEAAAIYLADRPYIYLYHSVLITGMTDRLEGLQAVPDSLFRLQGVRLGP